GTRRTRVQCIFSDAVPETRTSRAAECERAAAALLLSDRLHARAIAAGRGGISARDVPPGKPDGDAARLHYRGGAAGAWTVPRLQRGCARARRRRVVRRGRGEGVPRRRRRVSDDL